MIESETECQGMRPEWERSKDPCSGCGTRVNVAVYKYSRMADTPRGKAIVCCAVSLCPACARARAVKEKQGRLKGKPWL